MRQQQGRERLGQPRHMLGDVDQRDGEIARGVQDRKPSVQTSTTSPVVAAPRCQSVIAQASSAIVSTTVTPAWSSRSFSR